MDKTCCDGPLYQIYFPIQGDLQISGQLFVGVFSGLGKGLVKLLCSMETILIHLI